ncbi:MAG: NADH dehydrogenase [Clostridia bacterium]|nr:NADH dehydrogenase [Clostridia bacterium]
MLLPLLVFAPMALAVLAYAAGRLSRPLRTALVSLTCLGAFCASLFLWRGEAVFVWEGFCGLGLHLRADGFRSLYASVAAFMWLMSDLFAPEYFAHYHHRGRYYLFNLLTLGATLGVFLSDDLYTTLIFFEIMSLASYPWVAHEETEGAMRAAQTYLAVAVIGGLTTLMGLFMLWHRLGTLSFAMLREASEAAGGQDGYLTAAVWLTLFGFAAKAGLFPLHIWLPKAHPVAPAPASALLSGVLTKTGVFGLAVTATRLMAGNAAFANLLLGLGAVTMLLGAVLALFSVDLKRTLACSSASQIGFITVGLATMLLLGEEGGLAAYGAVEHMVNHSLIKLCLFLCAGTVYMNLHRLNLNDIRGFGRGKPVLHLCFLLGALSIGCIPPLGSGFNSKSLLHEGILEFIAHRQALGLSWVPYKVLELLFLFSGGLTIAYMTKLYICLFHEKHPTRQAEFDAMSHRYLSLPSALVLLGTALPLPLLGLLGSQLLSPLAARSMPFLVQEPPAHAIHYFSGENLLGAAESMAIGAAVYLLVVRRWLMARDPDGQLVYVDRWPGWLDMENNLYRPLLAFLTACFGRLFAFFAAIPDSRPVRRLGRALGAATAWIAALPDHPGLVQTVSRACTLAARGLAELPDRLVMVLRATLFRPRRPGNPEHPVTPAAALGRTADRAAAWLNRGLLKRHPLAGHYAERFVRDADVLEEEGQRVGRSVSYGLLLLAAGLFAAFLYLLLR